MKLRTKQITFLGMMLVFSMLVSYLERLIPPPIPAVPGIKLGLANIVVLILLYTKGYKTALILNIMRVLLSGLLFTGIWGAAYSMTGALLSFAMMLIFKAFKCFGIVGVSVVGGVCHNFGQICIAVIVTQTTKLFYYLPVLIISGVITGAVIGYVAGILLIRIQKSDIKHLYS